MLKYAKVRTVKSPKRGSGLSAGIDMFVPDDFEEVTLYPGQSVNISSGIHFDFISSGMQDWCLFFCNKSGRAAKDMLQVGACLVDADYQGEVHLDVHHIGGLNTHPVAITPGMKLVQGMILPVNYTTLQEFGIDYLFQTKTERGEGGFGSTGDN